MGWELPLGTAHPQQSFVQNCGQPPAWGHKVLGPDSPVRGWRRFLPWSSFSSGAGVGIEPREIMGFLSHHPKLSCYTRRDSRLLCPNGTPVGVWTFGSWRPAHGCCCRWCERFGTGTRLLYGVCVALLLWVWAWSQDEESGFFLCLVCPLLGHISMWVVIATLKVGGTVTISFIPPNPPCIWC